MKEKTVNHMETHVPGGVVFSTLNGCGDRPPYNALTAIEDAKGMLCQLQNQRLAHQYDMRYFRRLKGKVLELMQITSRLWTTINLTKNVPSYTIEIWHSWYLPY
jgi:hypothetical protein